MAQRRIIEPLVQESTPSIIAGKLRRAIAEGELAPGSQLGEAELARELGVSRGPLREATQRLTQEGLLLSIRNRGLFVITMNDDDIKDMYLARTAVERAAAAQLAVAAPGDARSVLSKTVAAMKEAAVAGDTDAVTSADLEFHEVLVGLAGSRRLSRMHNTLLTETRMCLNALKSTYRASDNRAAEHQGIADAIGAGDIELVDRLLISHMEDALQRLTYDPGNRLSPK
ncbi:GntR family transcriptional regulator [Arthrobacter sp. H5]|uniref:GntR family transcriptional regulator n=1 Tax=Arthrobacter sp. H5 TaxID=1267973 RepID=UPI0004B946E4|nr:GntR family transcriptional regulator [Arthrobacter sp. H5]